MIRYIVYIYNANLWSLFDIISLSSIKKTIQQYKYDKIHANVTIHPSLILICVTHPNKFDDHIFI